MDDRKLRAVIVFAALAGAFITTVSIGLYLFELPRLVVAGILVVYLIVQVRLAVPIYKTIYQGKIIDIPVGMRKRFPPLGYGFQDEECSDDYYDVILLRPPSAVLSGPDCGEALGLGYLGSVLRNNKLKVKIIDARLMGLDMMQTVELVMMYQTPMLGINLNFQYLAPSTEELINSLHNRGYDSHITLGGLYASVAHISLMKKILAVDSIVCFEGERTYMELVRQIECPDKWSNIKGLIYRDQNGSIRSGGLRQLVADLDTIPFPSRDFLPITAAMGGYAYVLSSRGCTGACTYCVQQRSFSDPEGKRWRGRHPDEVVNELEKIVKEHDISNVSFVDDDFFGPASKGESHAQKIAEKIIEKKLDLTILLSVQPRDVKTEIFTLLKRAGVESVILAVDNFSQTALDRYKKQTTVKQNISSIEILSSLGIDAYLGIIMFDPWTTVDELVENFKILQDLPFLRPWQILSKLEIYSGSPITEELDKQGLLRWDGHFAKYDYLDGHIKNIYESIEILMKVLHPSMAQLDSFRWGNLNYSDQDKLVLENSADVLAELNLDFNQQAIGMALEIVQEQKNSELSISSVKLANQRLQREADVLNQITLRNITNLRRTAVLVPDKSSVG